MTRLAHAILVAIALAAVPHYTNVHATVMSVDLGSEFLKLAGPRDSSVDICLNEQSHRKSDTFVGFRSAEERFFASDAKNLAPRFPDHMIAAVPRLVGVLHNDTTVVQKILRDELHYTLALEPNALRGTVNVSVPIPMPSSSAMSVSAEELLGMLFGYCKEQVERDIGTPVRDAVVVVPRSFNSRQRQAVVDSAAIAGIRVLALLHPTTAVALQLGLQNRGFGDEAKTVMIYDMGATKTDAAVYRFSPPKLGAKAGESFGTISLLGQIASDASLGGRAVDACTAEYLENEYIAKTPGAVRVLHGSTLADRKATFSLLRAANKAKEMLSANREAPVTVEGIAPDRDFTTKLQRATLESTCSKLWDRAVSVRDAALLSAEVTLQQLDRFEVVGGGLRVPIIIEKLSHGYGRGTVDRTLNADESAALGAGFFGAALAGHFRLKGFRLEEKLGSTVSVQASKVVRSAAAEDRTAWTSPRPLFVPSTITPARVRLNMNRTDDFVLRLAEPSGSGVLYADTELVGVHEALKSVGYDDPDAASKNISHTVQIDIRVSEGGLVFVERADVVVQYLVNVSRKVPRVVNHTLNTDSTAAPNETSDGDEASAPNDNSSAIDDDAEITDEDVGAKKPDAGESASTKPSATSSSNAAGKKKTSTSNKKVEMVSVVQLEPRQRSFPLVLTTLFSQPSPLSKLEATRSRDVLRYWKARDDDRLRLSTAKNNLEEYLIWARGEGFVANEESVKLVASIEDLQQAESQLQAVQDWLEEAGDAATVDVLEDKLAEAKRIVRVALRQPEKVVPSSKTRSDEGGADDDEGAAPEDTDSRGDEL